MEKKKDVKREHCGDKKKYRKTLKSQDKNVHYV